MCERSWRKSHSRSSLLRLNLENAPTEWANSFIWNIGTPNCFSVSFQFRSKCCHCSSLATNPATTTASVSSGEPLSSKYAVNIQQFYSHTLLGAISLHNLAESGAIGSAPSQGRPSLANVLTRDLSGHVRLEIGNPIYP